MGVASRHCNEIPTKDQIETKTLWNVWRQRFFNAGKNFKINPIEIFCNTCKVLHIYYYEVLPTRIVTYCVIVFNFITMLEFYNGILSALILLLNNRPTLLAFVNSESVPT